MGKAAQGNGASRAAPHSRARGLPVRGGRGARGGAGRRGCSACMGQDCRAGRADVGTSCRAACVRALGEATGACGEQNGGA